MNNFIKIKLCFLVILLMQISCWAQPETIRVRKESKLAKAYFDQTELKLIAIDRFGNPCENKIAAFKLTVKTNKGVEEFESLSSSLTPDMMRYLNSLKKAAKLFFTTIKALEDNTHLVLLPDVIEVWFPKCKGCQ